MTGWTVRVSSKPSWKLQSCLERLGRGAEPFSWAHKAHASPHVFALSLAPLDEGNHTYRTFCTGHKSRYSGDSIQLERKRNEGPFYAVGHAFPGEVHLFWGEVEMVCSERSFSGGEPEQCGSEGRPASGVRQNGSAIGGSLLCSFERRRPPPTWSQFFLPFHSIGVVKCLTLLSTRPWPPNSTSSLERTTSYSPAQSVPTR